MKAKLIRKPHLAPKIIVIDGLPGCGKTMLSPILASFDRTEVMTFSYELEFILTLAYLEKISLDAAETMIRSITDLKIYNLMMSREVNFRPSDLSSIFKNQSSFRYIRRLFQAGDEEVPSLIEERNPILIITTHQMTAISEPLFKSLGQRLVFIELVRHPLYMIKQHEENMKNINTQVRDFDLQIEYENQQIPFYAYGYEKDFIDSSPIERGILFIDKFTSLAEETKIKIKNNYKSQIITIPFEDYVLRPTGYMDIIAKALDTDITKRTLREMKKQKVPRKKIADGISLEIYKRFGWEPGKKGRSERDELNARYDYAISKNISKKSIEKLDKISKEYEMKYLSNIDNVL